ncbi:MAG: DNA-methyltransferase [Candidatus Odinarchaeota archaeon]
METEHKVYFKNSTDMGEIESNSIDLMITSPPYPMIEMWDKLFSSLNKEIKQMLEEEDSKEAFNLMHQELKKVWREVARVLKPGGIACINIGDATRKIDGCFQLFPNHIQVSNYFHENNFVELPCILWRKPTNSPNKFLGSGMIPPNAYVSLEHEYILIYRKGVNKRKFTPKSEKRYNSAFFWEERNKWFSDIWQDIKGTSQIINKTNNNQIRERSGAYPIELAYRLINMFSLYEDLILDPFWGTGTTSLASMISARNSIGYEINPEFMNIFKKNLKNIIQLNDEFNKERLNQHVKNMEKYKNLNKEIKYSSFYYKFPVITKQERMILLYKIIKYKELKSKFILNHKKYNFNIK